MHVQDIISKLLAFWAKRGCAVLQPLDLPVGAGTFHPATALRALGSEPWNAAYVQPSRRPTDGRYGRHLNRLQRYYQLQVVQNRETYLKSLETIGIRSADHDIRLVEDDWASPSLGAWGLGWEVWVDGMEVTQFTYFQEVGGLTCDPVMGEITYGIERLAMYLQDCDDVYKLTWSEGLSYGELHQRDELEQSSYNFEWKDAAELIAQFDRSAHLCDELLGHKPDSLIMPAYEQVINCSHTFNLLDAHGYYSVDARAAAIAAIRKLTSRVANAYVEQQKSRQQ
ncbi:MAG: glycine--tRNA ligase subunit alpha [Betaproteobacteria bacterium AqS2]|uniref:Glycine--tRNA ligase alpha subunit n=1 Tax=Candidatus Amphirhobacter heronislandensis TaxID=1732024 RepID=A0A930XXD3_9GAMM|nr:glycine--tRNA ligase subunit alpha [Betaproteobacteria bacterium AqS2]